MKALVFFSMTVLSATAFAGNTMKLERQCEVKAVSSAAAALGISAGDAISITTTTGSNYKPPYEVVAGENSVTLKNNTIIGDSGRYSFDSQSSGLAAAYEIFAGTKRLALLKEGSVSAYTGKAKAVLLISDKKVADLVCLHPNK